ncbi:unnamed protein product [Clonostachys rosea f. rosea IK726]|uniref:Major facilitator superfamily (MFS) profile domain-containing protein n=2 Tax=Bionectria ochroleuca TaxID=29856 RepID=A0A0B7KF74_BIOOC|nr:unnamed protein product [Clonostachys rosea f. rosea IK726]
MTEKSITPAVEAQPHDVEGLEKPATEELQQGVRMAEAVTLSWTRTSLIIVYACMWMTYFVRALQSSLTMNLSPYITSSFEGHSLLTVISTVVSIMSAATTMPVAKILNLWDRTVAFSFMLTLSVIGLILNAACNDIATYCAAQVFYNVGSAGLIFSVDVLTADTSTLRNRGLAFAFTSSPYIITAFAGSPLSERFHESDWRWAYGTITILLPLVTLPIILTWSLARKKAIQNHVVEKDSVQRTLPESIKYYLIEFDAVGIFLLIAGFCLLLLPMTLATSQPESWRTDYIIAMIVLGGVLVIAFALYEKFLSPKPFIPWHLLANRTVMGACLVDLIYQIGYYCWAMYFTSYLRVVFDVSITQAGYIASIFDFVSPICLILAGYLMRVTQRFRWLLLVAVPLYVLFAGLMIYFRTPGRGVGFIVMCEVFIGIAGGVMILCQQIAVMAASKHEDYAAMLALLGLFGNIGGAIGNSVSGAVWTNTLPQKLAEYLPVDDLPNLDSIYEDLEVQMSYAVGTPTRDAIIAAYVDAQRNMLIAGTAIMVLALAFVFLIKNIKLTDTRSLGMVF